jgi:hypothetical protein
VTFLLSHDGEALGSAEVDAPLNREGRKDFPIMIVDVQVNIVFYIRAIDEENLRKYACDLQDT